MGTIQFLIGGDRAYAQFLCFLPAWLPSALFMFPAIKFHKAPPGMRFLNSCAVYSKSVARSESIDSSRDIHRIILGLSGELPCGSVRMPDSCNYSAYSRAGIDD
jgi:hypothetical protein